jgi:endo-1,4-beta-xylanase
VEPEQGKFDFSEMDAIVRFAQLTHKRVRGHPLLWDQQLPDWVGDLSKEELAAAMDRHITTIAKRYRGKIAEWDVVNEPFDDDGSLTESVFMKKLGAAYIGRAFRTARAADPEATLFLNEIGAEPGVPKNKALYNLVKFLKDRDVPIDGVGLQNHRSDEGYPTREQLLGEFARYRKLGVKVAITEMDVISDSASGSEGQTFAYQAAAAACVSAPNCTGLTVWGITDEHSWLGADKHPLLYDAGGKPKPAVAALKRILER